MTILDELMGEYGFSVPTAAYRKLQKQLAARQPVGEPVAWYYGFSDTGEAGPVTFGGDPGAEAIAWAERHGHTLHYLYTAPPAVVDLDQFRDAIEMGMKHCNGFLGDKDAAAKLGELLALLDSKAVRNG